MFVDRAWWGWVGFDDCVEDREWTQIEIDALRAAAGTLGAAIHRQRSEQQFREAEERYRSLVERTPVITYQEQVPRDDAGEGSVLYLSPQAGPILGYPADRWSIRGFWRQILHPDDLERVLAANERAIEIGKPYSEEYRIVTADGRIVWFRDDAVLIRDEPGGPVVWQGVLVDITERKRAEKSLLETEERYRTLVEQVPVVIYTQAIDPDDPTVTNTIYISPRIEGLLGYTDEEMVETPLLWRHIIHPDDRDEVTAVDIASNATGEDFSMEYRVIAKDGREVWIHDEASVVRDADGVPRSWQGFMLDVTERRLAEERLEQALAVEREAARRLRSLDEMKNTFLQAVSHDLRTPLAAILGLAVTLERADLELDHDETHDLAHRIATNARKLDRMVTDLLDLDRLARGIVEPKLLPTDVGALVLRIAGDSDLKARGRMSVDAPSVVAEVDPAKVERIVENLLANISRHTPEGTHVWVRVERAPHGVLLIVEDDGPGIPAGSREAIFEPFRQGPDAPEHSPGVGVGLTLVRRFAELQGGRAWVEAREGGGASFRVLLPAASGDAGSGRAGAMRGGRPNHEAAGRSPGPAETALEVG